MSPNRLGTSKDVEKLARLARKHGMKIEITGGNHIKWIGSSGQIYYTGLTPSSRYTNKLKKFLRSEGVPV